MFALSSEYTAISIRIDPNQPSDTRGRIIARRRAKQRKLYPVTAGFKKTSEADFMAFKPHFAVPCVEISSTHLQAL